jgi:Fic family protein
VRAAGDWEAWLEFFLTGVKETSAQAAQSAHQILTLLEEDRIKIAGLKTAASALKIHQYMQRRPILTIPTAAQLLALSAPTVTKALLQMQDLGLVREQTGKPRHRRFVYERYLAILNTGTEPIDKTR